MRFGPPQLRPYPYLGPWTMSISIPLAIIPTAADDVEHAEYAEHQNKHTD